jgi:hypothetical protein
MSAAEQPESRRLTPTERLHEVTMAAVQRAASPPEHTVSLALNAKGDVQIEVTGRGHDLDMLEASVAASFDWLRAKYPRGNGGS